MLAIAESWDNGKPVRETLAADIPLAADHFRYFGSVIRGEEGSFDEERWPPATLGAVREQELIRSLDVLGVTEHHWLDYHDGTCAEVDHSEGVQRVLEILRDADPDSVFTFGPDGMTGHPDHKADFEAFMKGETPGR